MTIGVYPGSFDPITYGHLDIILRGSKIVDQLIVGVLDNKRKTPLFLTEEKLHMLKMVAGDIPNVKFESFSGLLVDFMKKKNATLVIRGLRANSDFEYELQMAQTNNKLDNTIETVFLATRAEYSFVSSSLVKEIWQFDGDITHFVPPEIYEFINKKKV